MNHGKLEQAVSAPIPYTIRIKTYQNQKGQKHGSIVSVAPLTPRYVPWSWSNLVERYFMN